MTDLLPLLDIDGNGPRRCADRWPAVTAHLTGLRGDALVNGALGRRRHTHAGSPTSKPPSPPACPDGFLSASKAPLRWATAPVWLSRADDDASQRHPPSPLLTTRGRRSTTRPQSGPAISMLVLPRVLGELRPRSHAGDGLRYRQEHGLSRQHQPVRARRRFLVWHVGQAAQRGRCRRSALRSADFAATLAGRRQAALIWCCSLVLEHLRDLSPYFEEAARVLAPGGHLWVCELHPTNSMPAARRALRCLRGHGEGWTPLPSPVRLHRRCGPRRLSTCGGSTSGGIRRIGGAAAIDFVLFQRRALRSAYSFSLNHCSMGLRRD